MTKPATHTVAGFDFTRKSPRNYLFVVIGRYDAEADISKYRAARIRNAKEDFAYHVEQAAKSPAEAYSYYNAEDAAKAHARCAELAALGLEGFIAHRLEEAAAQARRLDVATALQWSMSERAARNAVRAYENRGYTDVAVFPVIRAA